LHPLPALATGLNPGYEMAWCFFSLNLFPGTGILLALDVDGVLNTIDVNQRFPTASAIVHRRDGRDG
jgi:hypothetical protein